MKAIERFYQYLEYKGIKPTRFEKDNGLSNGYLGTQLKRNGSLGEDTLNTIVDNCLDLNPVWLLTGKGYMTNSIATLDSNDENKLNQMVEPSSQVYRMKTDKMLQKQSVPLYDIQASASVVALFRDQSSEKPVDHITIPNLPKCDGAIYVSGDSMYPLLKSGDIIMYKKLANTVDNIFWGEMYLVSLINDDGDEFVMVKWIHKSDQGEDFIKLVSENRHHQPKDFHIKNVKGLALIKASVRINSMY
jgi:phage repressor protein C with HTH and peptisase S24 domain